MPGTNNAIKVKKRDLDNGTNSMYCIVPQVTFMGKCFPELKFIVLVSLYASAVVYRNHLYGGIPCLTFDFSIILH